MKKTAQLLLLCVGIGLLLSGCVEVKDYITFNTDGSGEETFSLIVNKTFAELAPQMKTSLAKDMPQANISIENDKSGNRVVVARQTFKNVSECRNDLYAYNLTLQRLSPFRTQYNFEGLRTKKRINPSVAIPVEVKVTFPGAVEITNGEKIDSRTVRWQWVAGVDQEVRQLTASATATPISPLAIGVGSGVVVIILVTGGIFFVLRRKKSGVNPSNPDNNGERNVFCTECGTPQSATVKFCTACGHRTDEAGQ